jgi:predicted dienelactone hydrolase
MPAGRSTSYGAPVRRLTALALVAALSAACGGDDGERRTATTTSTTAEPSATPPAEAYAVGRKTLEVVDRSRPTDADDERGLPAEPDRTMEVLLLYPAEGAVVTPTAPSDDAEPAEGAFPLVVFAHGVGGTGPAYEIRIKELARAGYVVAAPTFPRSSGPGAPTDDYVNQPADMSFVIDELLGLPDDHPLAGHIDEDTIAAMGHSLGAMSTIGLALHTCCLDDRVDAAVALSGTRLPFDDGRYDLDATPFLAVHGGADSVVPVEGSDSLFADAPGPAAYLRFPEGDHTTFLFTEAALVDEVVLSFLDRYLRGDEDALDDVPELVEEHPSATFEAKPAP